MDAKLNRSKTIPSTVSRGHSRATSPIGRRRESGRGETVDPNVKEEDEEKTSFSLCLRFLADHSVALHLIVGIIWILFGVIYFVIVERCYVVTGFYFITQVVSTIGYGDVVPTTNTGKLITTFYAFGTILYLGSLINLLIQTLNDKVSSFETAYSPRMATGCVAQVEEFFQKWVLDYCGAWQGAVTAFIKFMFLVLLGTVFYATYEKCTCSYGIDTVQGCIDTSFATCAATGGDVKTWTDSFYMCVITLTTVGFGDYTPMSSLGRLLFIPWAFVGVVSMANFATSFAVALSQSTSLPKERSEEDLRANLKDLVGDRERFNEMDFIMFFLQVNDRIPKSQMTIATNAFQKMDKAGTGRISEEDALYFAQHNLSMHSKHN